MEKRKRGIRRLLKILLWVIIAIPVLLIIFISPITKYWVEKNDVKYTGREITMDWAYVNPFTGYVYLSNVKIMEAKKDTVFLSANGISANFEMWQLFSGNYILSDLTLDNPRGILVQNHRDLNIDDVVDRFTGKKTTKTKKKAPVHFSILQLTINNGEFHYRELVTPVNLFIKKVNIVCSGIRWDSDTIGFSYHFSPGIGTGDMRGHFNMNTKNLDYKLAAVLHEFDLNFIDQYLKDLVNYGTFRAHLDADILATGNFHSARKLDAKGLLEFNDFHFGKDSADDFASFEKLKFDIQQLNPDQHKYLFDSVLLYHPICKYERYDSLDNIQAMFGQGGSNVAAVNSEKFNLVITIAKYIKQLSKEFLASYYQIKKFGVYQANLRYSDFSLNEKFSAAANPLTIEADSVDKRNKRVNLTMTTAVEPYGDASVFLSINPNDSGEFDLRYDFKNFPAAMFNPYLITYTSFPLDRGTIQLNGTWTVRNSNIQSENHLIVLDPRVSKRVRKKDTKWLPTPLIMAFIRERGNVIDYEIPIKGSLKNPKFKLKDVFGDLVKNIFIKPPTTPYRFQVKTVEDKVEKSLSLKWDLRQAELYPHQQSFVDEIAEFLHDNPQARVTVTPLIYAEKEKEYILFFEAKKKYFLTMQNRKGSALSESDSVTVDHISNKDVDFMAYLNKVCNDTMLYTVQDQCYCFIGHTIVDEKYKELEATRKRAFLAAFKEKGCEKQIQFKNSENVIPYNGYTIFKLNYNGEIPDFLVKAFHKMDELNEEGPRKKYFRLRKMNWRIGLPLPEKERSKIISNHSSVGFYFSLDETFVFSNTKIFGEMDLPENKNRKLNQVFI